MKRENQIGFRPGVGCQHPHCILASLLLDNNSKSKGIYICALNFSKAFDSASTIPSQLFYSLYNSGLNFSVILLLQYWYSNSFLSLKPSPTTTIKAKRDVSFTSPYTKVAFCHLHFLKFVFLAYLQKYFRRIYLILQMFHTWPVLLICS